MAQTVENNLELEVGIRLQRWYKEMDGDKKFPWRTSENPYKTLIAELLLQRTKGETIGRVYTEFLSSFPTPWHILQAGVSGLEEYFKKIGLGYRAKRLYSIMEIIVGRYNGQVPCKFRELLTFPGVGVYIASAVMNFGCRIPTPVVDVNVMRVLNRIYGIDREIDARAKIWRIYMGTDPRVVGYSLIDLGREVCTSSPNCETCPLNDICPKYPVSSQWRMLRKIIKGGRVILREQPVKTSKKIKKGARRI